MDEQPPDTETDRLFVPLREAGGCGVSLRLFRDRQGARCAVGFTSVERLTAVLGKEQRYYKLTQHAVRALARERGAEEIVVDPGLVAAPVHAHETLEPAASDQPLPRRSAALRANWDPQTAGILAVSAVTGAATLAMQVLK